MKALSYLLVVASTVMGVLASCSKFLEENPQDSRHEEAAYATVQELFQNGVLSLYNHMGGFTDSEGLQGTGRGVYELNILSTDETIKPTCG